LLFTDALEEDGQVMMIIELLNFNLPVNLVLGTMFNGNREITSVVESSEFR
jgi:hypothetical protein